MGKFADLMSWLILAGVIMWNAVDIWHVQTEVDILQQQVIELQEGAGQVSTGALE